MPFCATCGLLFPEGRFCPLDGAGLVEPDDPLLGRVLAGRYRMVERIGEGGMGVVYRAQHVHVDRKVAVKVMPHELSGSAELKARFLREARAANLVKHENIVDVFDLGETEDHVLYLAMELLEGEVLASAIRGRDMPLGRIVPILRQICGALGPLHAMGIVHRDLKPENVFLVVRDGDRDFVKILDFGIAHLGSDPRLTKQGHALGTPEFMAPEIVMGQKVGPGADLYSLGCMAYEMVAGEPPFHGGNPVEIMARQVQATPAPLRDMCPSVSSAFHDLVMKLIEKEPDRRLPDAYAVVRALDEILPPRQPAVRVSASRAGEKRRLELPPVPLPNQGITGAWKEFAEKTKGRAKSDQRKLLYEMEELTGKLETLGTMVDRVASQVELIESERREASLRIQHAIDELGREASNNRLRLMKRREKLAALESEIAIEDIGIAAAIEGLAGDAPAIRGSGMDDAVLGRCERLGELACDRRDHGKRREALDLERRSFESGISDIGFQIDALCGRLQSMNDDSESNLTALRARLESIERERSEIESRLASLASRAT